MSEHFNRGSKAYKLAVAFNKSCDDSHIPADHRLELAERARPLFWLDLAKLAHITGPSRSTIDVARGILQAMLSDPAA